MRSGRCLLTLKTWSTSVCFVAVCRVGRNSTGLHSSRPLLLLSNPSVSDTNRYIKPGAGQIEHVEIDWQPRSYPATFPEDAQIVQQWWNCLRAASSQQGSSIAFPDTTEQSLEAAGFVDITRRKTRVPFYCKEGDQKEFQLNKR